MWVLETEGDALQGKKLWLRPGKKFLFGRTQADAGQFVISDKTISRRHLTVEIDAARPGDCANGRTRSRVTLHDLDTKIGTLVNGEQIRGKTHVLQKDVNVVALGKYKHRFTFTWIPVTLTFSFGLKEAKANPYTALYELLGPLDIKVLVEYEHGLTTHLVAKKRNTPKGLQALIDGKFVVHNDSFIKAIVAAATPVSPTEEGAVAKSPLEEDWVNSFPNSLEYLPPRGEEPTERDDSAYAPDLNRQDIFEGYTFIFYERRQFETLLAPITEGHGKALFREVVPNETLVNDFVGYVKGVAGEKGLGGFDHGSEGKGVVVVRFNPMKGPGSEWFSDFNRQVSLYLDHRLIEQNEFLDAILGNDASVLRRPLELEPSGVIAPPQTAATASISQTLRSSQPCPTPQPTPQVVPQEFARRDRSRRTVTTRFKGFDDGDDDQVNLNYLPESSVVDQAPFLESQSQGLFVTQDPEMEIDHVESQTETTQHRSSRKRGTPPVDYELEEGDIMERLAPVAAALKKRRLADGVARRLRGESTLPVPVIKEKPNLKAQPGKAKVEVDLFELARKKREKEEKKAREEGEDFEEAALDVKEIEALRNLAIVEDMEVTRPSAPLRVAYADDSDRWDDKWNGRKNFKKFRRRGADSGLATNFHRVIVPLEEVKKKDFGIGDDYWLDTDAQRKKKGKGRDTQDAFESQSQARTKNRATARATEILASEAEEELAQTEAGQVELPSSDVEIMEPSPSPSPTSKLRSVTPRRTQRSEKLVDKTSTSQNLPAKNKRAASSSLAKPPPTKKVKQSTRKEVSDDSDDDDDELRFKFRRRV